MIPLHVWRPRGSVRAASVAGVAEPDQRSSCISQRILDLSPAEQNLHARAQAVVQVCELRKALFLCFFFFTIPTSFTHSHSSFPTFCCLLLPVLWAPNHFLKAQMERLVTSCFKRCLCQMPPTQNFRLLWQFWGGARLFAPSTLQSGADARGAESKQCISDLEETYTCV